MVTMHARKPDRYGGADGDFLWLPRLRPLNYQWKKRWCRQQWAISSTTPRRPPLMRQRPQFIVLVSNSVGSVTAARLRSQ